MKGNVTSLGERSVPKAGSLADQLRALDEAAQQVRGGRVVAMGVVMVRDDGRVLFDQVYSTSEEPGAAAMGWFALKGAMHACAEDLKGQPREGYPDTRDDG